MEVFDAIFDRLSYRGTYVQTPVPREDLTRILEAGVAAPSGCNKQTASFIALDDSALVGQCGALLHKPNFASAPAAICVLTRDIPGVQGRHYHVQDYAAAIENMLLAITALGYASCWVEGNVTIEYDNVGRRIADVLGVPEEYRLVAYLPVGKPAESGKRAEKQPFAERAWYNGFEKRE